MVVIEARESGSGRSFATSRTAASLASMPASFIIIMPALVSQSLCLVLQARSMTAPHLFLLCTSKASKVCLSMNKMTIPRRRSHRSRCAVATGASTLKMHRTLGHSALPHVDPRTKSQTKYYKPIVKLLSLYIYIYPHAPPKNLSRTTTGSS